MSSKKYNITAIAKLAGVSPATVSRALNNHPYVTKEVHDKVFDAVHRLGYQPRMPSDRKRLAIIIDNPEHDLEFLCEYHAVSSEPFLRPA